jgi:hypothetical protein
MLSTINDLMTKAYILAEGELDPAVVNKVTTQPLWESVLKPVAAAVGAVVVLVGLFRAVTQVMSGKGQGAFKTVAMTIVGAAILFNLNLVFDLIGLGGTVVQSVVDSLTGLVGEG